MIVEIFRPVLIDGERTQYLVSDHGSIRSLINNRMLTPSKNDAGYYRVNIVHKNRIYSKRIHILVANAFIPNPNNKPTVNHINGIKTDNRVCNLEWATYAENNQHAFRTGLNHGPRGELNARSIYTEDQIRSVCTLLEQNQITIPKISKLTGVKPLTIRHLRKKKRWKHIVKDYDFSKYDKMYCKK